jgi:pimeloyl-ACP methyl ester carboxylesterase
VRLLLLAVAVIVFGGACAAQEETLPEPTGDYAVGTTRLLFVDRTRPEVFTEEPADFREVTARAWYPADPGDGAARTPYYEHAEDIVRNFGYPAGLAGFGTNSWLDVPVSAREGAYPVVIFNHGWGEHASQSTILMEELASHGYIVLSLAHPYEAKFWVYPDGRVAYLDFGSPRFEQIVAEQRRPEFMGLFYAMFTTRGIAAQDSLFKQMVEAMPVFLRDGPRMWAADIGFVIDRLDSLNASPGIFKGRLDLEKLGVMGMSMGGAAAQQACLGESRIVAAINMDGGLLGDLPDKVVAQPLMYINSKRFVGYDDVLAAHAAGDVYVVTIPDADHYDFSDFTLINRGHAMIGTVDGRRMTDIVNGYTRAFFDFYLRGVDSDLLSGKERPYPEATLYTERRP